MYWLLLIPIALLAIALWVEHQERKATLKAFQAANHDRCNAILVDVRRREPKKEAPHWGDSMLVTEIPVERTSVLPELDAERLRKETGPR